MKRFVAVNIVILAGLILLIAPNAWGAFEITLDLPSGVTTQPNPSGTTPFKINNVDANETIDDVQLLDGDFTLQVQEILTEHGATSGVTYTISYKESLIDDYAHWSAATGYVIVGPTLVTSGETPYQVPFYPNMTKYLKFYIESGVSGFRRFIARVMCK